MTAPIVTRADREYAMTIAFLRRDAEALMWLDGKLGMYSPKSSTARKIGMLEDIAQARAAGHAAGVAEERERCAVRIDALHAQLSAASDHANATRKSRDCDKPEYLEGASDTLDEVCTELEAMARAIRAGEHAKETT